MKIKFLQGFRRKQKDILCIAIHGSRLEAAVTAADGAIVKFMQRQLPDSGTEYLEEAMLQQEIELLITENRLPKLQQLVFVLDTEHVLLQRLSLPDMPEAELREAVRWEAEEYLPAGGEESCLDFFAAPVVERKRAVLLAAMPQDVMQTLRQAAGNLQMELLAVTARPLAQAAFLGQEQENFLLLTAEQDMMMLTAFADGMPSAWSTAEKTQQAVEEAAAALAEQLWQKYQLRPRNIFFTQGCAAVTDWTDGIREIAGQQYCLTAVDFNNAAPWQGSFLTADERAEGVEMCMAAAGGALVAAKRNASINFQRSRYAQKSSAKMQKLPYLTAGVLLFTAALWAGAAACNYYEASQIDDLQRQIDGMGIWKQRYAQSQLLERRIKERSTQIAALEKEQTDWGELLETFGRNIPDGCWLNKVQQEDGRSSGLLLYGRADELASVEKFAAALQESGHFAKVELVETQAQEKNGFTDYMLRAGKGDEQNE